MKVSICCIVLKLEKNTIFKEKAGHGVLLNTSFNIAGKPILNTIADAVKVLEKTQMDYLIIEDFWYGKHW